jgi:hypothetical protein
MMPGDHLLRHDHEGVTLSGKPYSLRPRCAILMTCGGSRRAMVRTLCCRAVQPSVRSCRKRISLPVSMLTCPIVLGKGKRSHHTIFLFVRRVNTGQGVCVRKTVEKPARSVKMQKHSCSTAPRSFLKRPFKLELLAHKQSMVTSMNCDLSELLVCYR